MKTFASRAATGATVLMLIGAGLPINSDDTEVTAPPGGGDHKAIEVGSEGRSTIEADSLGGPGVSGVALMGSMTIVLGAGAFACVATRRSEFT